MVKVERKSGPCRFQQVGIEPNDGNFCPKLHYLSGDVVSGLLQPYLALGVRRCSALAIRLGGKYVLFGRPSSSLPSLSTRLHNGAHHCVCCYPTRVASSVRSFFTSVTALPLPLFRLTSLRVCAGAVQLPFVFGGYFVLFGRPPSRFATNNETLQQASARPCFSGWDRGYSSLTPPSPFP
jgi:hypothetical protein